MSKNKIDANEIIDDVIKSKRKRPLNWVDRLDKDSKEFMYQLKRISDTEVIISPVRVAEKLKEHFGVSVSDNQVRRFLSGELHAEENFDKKESSNR